MGRILPLDCDKTRLYGSAMNDKPGTRTREEPSSPPQADTMFALLSAAHALEQRLEDAMAKVGLSMAKFGVLSQLASAAEPLALSDVAARLACVRSNITQLVDRLESDGSVRRVADATDRRSIRAEITALGRERQTQGARELARLQKEFAASISPRDRAALDRLISSIT